MEISGFSPYVEGINNLFVYNDNKNLYKVTLRTYIGNTIEKNTDETSLESVSIENLEKIFDIDEEIEEKQEEVAKQPKKVNKRKSVVSKNTHNNVFGEFGQ